MPGMWAIKGCGLNRHLSKVVRKDLYIAPSKLLVVNCALSGRRRSDIEEQVANMTTDTKTHVTCTFSALSVHSPVHVHGDSGREM